jgi:hypothetical protein
MGCSWPGTADDGSVVRIGESTGGSTPEAKAAASSRSVLGRCLAIGLAAGTIGMVRESFEERRDRLFGQVPGWYRPALGEHDAETGFLLGSTT